MLVQYPVKIVKNVFCNCFQLIWRSNNFFRNAKTVFMYHWPKYVKCAKPAFLIVNQHLRVALYPNQCSHFFFIGLNFLIRKREKILKEHISTREQGMPNTFANNVVETGKNTTQPQKELDKLINRQLYTYLNTTSTKISTKTLKETQRKYRQTKM